MAKTTRVKKVIIFLSAVFFFGSLNAKVISFKLPKTKVIKLKPYSKIKFAPINEGSAFAKSGMWENVFWTLNDSGGRPVIFPLDKDGKILSPGWFKKYKGVKIPEAFNEDWEALCRDDKGHLIISDMGNNSNYRRDLTLYWIAEPYPGEAIASHIIKKVSVYYPKQKRFPAKIKDFDSEAIVYFKGKVYIFTKNRSDTLTSLYRLDSLKTDTENPLTLLSTFNAHSMVTDADINEEGTKLVLLTYKYLWVFDLPTDSDNFFLGKAYFLPIEALQCEGVVFNGKDIIITNEQRDMFKVRIKDLIPIKKR